MSLENKVKNTTNKLKEKYSKTSWDYLFNLIFESDAWSTALYQLMSDRGAGEQFFPKFNNIFRSFDLCPLDKVKVVIVAPCPEESSDGLAFSGETNPFIDSINNITNSPLKGTSLDYLPGQEGVMLLNASLTGLVSKPKNHVQMWTPIIKQMIDQIGYRTTKVMFVFVGEETQHLGQYVRKGHYQYFIPMWTETNNDWNHVHMFTNTNNFLKKIGREPINW